MSDYCATCNHSKQVHGEWCWVTNCGCKAFAYNEMGCAAYALLRKSAAYREMEEQIALATDDAGQSDAGLRERIHNALQMDDRCNRLHMGEEQIDRVADVAAEIAATVIGGTDSPRYETTFPTAEGIYILKDDTGNLWMPISIYKKSFPVERLIYESFGEDGYDDLSKLDQRGYRFAKLPEPGDGRNDGT